MSKLGSAAFLALCLLFACGMVNPPTSSAATVACGEVLTDDTVVENDLSDCPGDGLVIGAPDIVVNLNGHTIDGEVAICDGAPCEPRHQGIDNEAGHDGVTIKNGTVTGFRDGIRLVNAEGNVLEHLTVQGTIPVPLELWLDPARPLVLVGSHDNQIHDLEARGHPALLLLASDRNSVSESDLIGSASQPFDAGRGIEISEGSDDNKISDSTISGDHHGTGALIRGSSRNEIRDSDVNANYHYGATLVLRESEDTAITGNDLGAGVILDADGTHFAHNTLDGDRDNLSLDVTGSFNVISRNDVEEGSCADSTLEVSDGDWNVVKRNYVPSGSLRVATENTVVKGNYVTGACATSGLIAGASTILKRNIVTHSAGHGIEASRGAMDAGGNRASFNAERPQCVNVRCRPAKECPGFAIGNGALDECESAPRAVFSR